MVVVMVVCRAGLISGAGQGACREVGSERLEENHRVAINGSNPNCASARQSSDGFRMQTGESFD